MQNVLQCSISQPSSTNCQELNWGGWAASGRHRAPVSLELNMRSHLNTLYTLPSRDPTHMHMRIQCITAGDYFPSNSQAQTI